MSQKEATIICQNVWKIFGPDPESVYPLAENGMGKQEILEQTGHVLAVKDVSFEVEPNEILETKEEFTIVGGKIVFERR